MTSEELSLLSSLRFAPLDRSYEFSPATHAHKHKSAIAQEIALVEEDLQDAVLGHQAILVYKRRRRRQELPDARSNILDLIEELQSLNETFLANKREEVMKLHAQREDYDAVVANLSESVDETGDATVEARLDEIKAELNHLQNRMETLNRERLELENQLLARADERRESATRLSNLGSRADLQKRVKKESAHVARLEREVEALEKGTVRLQASFEALDDAESSIAMVLKNKDRIAASAILEELVNKLEEDLEYARQRDWKLIEAITDSEWQNALGAYELMQSKLEEEAAANKQTGAD